MQPEGLPNIGLSIQKKKKVVLLTLVDGLYEEGVYQNSDRVISSTFPNLELTEKEVLQTNNE
jgi:hypothetical protein